MSKIEPRFAAATGISVGGNSAGSQKVAVAMQSAALAAHAARDFDGEKLQADMQKARHDAKPMDCR